MPTSREIRQTFLDFFVQKHGHRLAPSSPVVPHDDPTLLFTNAGMNQFKDVFLGTGRRDYTRAANTQKCIRAGGKHNDLEDVGKDTYHHTFFEMLGNWSFGDYFKKEAIEWAWELVVGVWKFPPGRLYATIYNPDKSRNDPSEFDQESWDLWAAKFRSVGLDPAVHIVNGNKKDNFWMMGDTGPCGPCSELHVDLTPKGDSRGSLVNKGDARCIEIWNLVFIQFNANPDGSFSPLPAKHVDTGMGFERLTSIIQGTKNFSDFAGANISNYNTDLFSPIFAAIQEVTRARPYGGKLDDPIDIAYRVLADHIRCLTFALTDGAVPSNEGRGYVLRRILRRAVRHGRQTLGVKEPFFYRLVPAVVDAMSEAFPELKKNSQSVIDIIKDEEVSFGKTWDRGIALFEDAAKEAGSKKTIAAGDAFKLHDTYGFPLDLTQVMAEERGMAVDVAGFEKLMEQARQQARGGGGAIDAKESLVTIVQQEKLPATRFTGYESTENPPVATSVRVYVLGEQGYSAAVSADTGSQVAVVVDRTPFYAEAGGQVGDTGVMQAAGGATSSGGGGRLQILDTIQVGDIHFHLGKIIAGSLQTRPGQMVAMAVDRERRAKIMANHTATHVMNHKLRAVLGEHIQQRGSLVDDQKLRFDFSHPSSLDTGEIDKIEQLVNADIAADLPVYAKQAPQEQALKVHGLRAVFGEKYPPVVRVVSIGVSPDELLKNPANKDWYENSVEFCGGTHLSKTGDAEGFVIVAEEAVGKGLRRITAMTGSTAHQAQAHAERLMHRLEAVRSGAPEVMTKAIAELSDAAANQTLPAIAKVKLREGVAELQKIIKEHQKDQSKAAAGSAVEEARQIAEQARGQVIVAAIGGADGDALRAAMDVIRKKKPEAALLLGGVSGDGADAKVSFVAAVPEALIKKGLKAGDWVREVAKAAGGGGGGRPDMAQAGGKEPSKFNEALEVGRKFAASKIG